MIPFSFDSVDTFKIVNINKKAKEVSNRNDCIFYPVGNVAPSNRFRAPDEQDLGRAVPNSAILVE
jgi:hypothetical protein